MAWGEWFRTEVVSSRRVLDGPQCEAGGGHIKDCVLLAGGNGLQVLGCSMGERADLGRNRDLSLHPTMSHHVRWLNYFTPWTFCFLSGDKKTPLLQSVERGRAV